MSNDIKNRMCLAGDGEDLSDEAALDWAESRIAELEAIVNMLPKYADTGQPFLPDKDEAWFVWKGTPMRTRGTWFWNHGTGAWSCRDHPDDWNHDLPHIISGKFYSTHEAAQYAYAVR